MASDWENKSLESSAIVDMENVSGDDSDYDTNFDQGGDPHKRSASATGGEKNKFMEDVQQNVTSMMFEAGKQQAKRAFSLYGNIDILRPYFDVEPHQVRERLLWSLIPRKPSGQRQQVPQELYGPLMVVFTLIAMLLFQMKSMGHIVQEGTLMGTAFGVCFGYWLGISSLVWFMAYVCATQISALQVLSMLGYALFSHCIVLFLGTVMHTAHDHIIFYILWASIGGLASLKMVGVLMSRTSGHTQKMIISGTVTALHLLFLLYLYFAYHQVVEELSSVVDKPIVPRPIFHEKEVGTVMDSIGKQAAEAVTQAAKAIEKPKIESVEQAVTKLAQSALAGTAASQILV